MSAVIIKHPAPAIAAQRRRLEDAIERAIAALDALGGDPDLEDGGDDEPSLSASVGDPYGSQNYWLRGREDDLEEACEDEGGEHDGREASLCGISFGTPAVQHSVFLFDAEGTGAPFTMDHRETEGAR